jgi:hypothetical protein
MLLITINNGYSTNGIDYLFQEFEMNGIIVPYSIMSSSQVLMGTDRGIILLDLSCTINGEEFTDINLFITSLRAE